MKWNNWLTELRSWYRTAFHSIYAFAMRSVCLHSEWSAWSFAPFNAMLRSIVFFLIKNIHVGHVVNTETINMLHKINTKTWHCIIFDCHHHNYLLFDRITGLLHIKWPSTRIYNIIDFQSISLILNFTDIEFHYQCQTFTVLDYTSRPI